MLPPPSKPRRLESPPFWGQGAMTHPASRTSDDTAVTMIAEKESIASVPNFGSSTVDQASVSRIACLLTDDLNENAPRKAPELLIAQHRERATDQRFTTQYRPRQVSTDRRKMPFTPAQLNLQPPSALCGGTANDSADWLCNSTQPITPRSTRPVAQPNNNESIHDWQPWPWQVGTSSSSEPAGLNTKLSGLAEILQAGWSSLTHLQAWCTHSTLFSGRHHTHTCQSIVAILTRRCETRCHVPEPDPQEPGAPEQS